MQCVICNGGMAYYFSKDFDAFGLSRVDYWRCEECGFTMSKTHADMSDDDWASLNHAYHAAYQGTESNPDDPRWIARLKSQAEVISDIADIGLLDGNGSWLDYACGDGKLSELLRDEGHTLQKYDRYMSRQEGYLKENELVPGSFDFAITTSVFEHLTLREQFDSIAALVSDNGVLGLHTLVSEIVPCDSSWFYLLPVHCAFHTNKSMSVLFSQWGYASSIYNVESRLWFWFKQPPPDLERRVEDANRRSGKPSYAFKNGFMDYWRD